MLDQVHALLARMDENADRHDVAALRWLLDEHAALRAAERILCQHCGRERRRSQMKPSTHGGWLCHDHVTCLAGTEQSAARTSRIRIAAIVDDAGLLLAAAPYEHTTPGTLTRRDCVVVEADVAVRAPHEPPVVTGRVVEVGSDG